MREGKQDMVQAATADVQTACDHRPAKRKRAQGTSPKNERMIAVRFTEEVFDQIADAAVEANRSFAKQIRYYVGLGMDASTRKHGK